MIGTVPDILARIVAKKREDLARSASRLDEWQRLAEENRAHRDFHGALAARIPAIISEIKKASPSKGVLCADFDPLALAGAYQSGGASALSVLTDESFFQGSLGDLQRARSAVSLPVLRKDFTISPWHVWEAAAHAADAVLLIAAILEERELRDFRELAEGLGMAALVEVHDRAELEKAKGSGARIIGVNNRDLVTFRVTLETSERLAGHMPPGALLVSESGIRRPEDIRRLRACGYAAFLVGEHLVKSPDPAGALRELVNS